MGKQHHIHTITTVICRQKPIGGAIHIRIRMTSLTAYNRKGIRITILSKPLYTIKTEHRSNPLMRWGMSPPSIMMGTEGL